MKILIVDDNASRSKALSKYIIEKNLAYDGDVVVIDNHDGAKDLLESCYFDVLILDVVLPKRTNESPDPKWSVGLLGHISRSSRFKKPEKIIGLTAHLDDIGKFRVDFDKYCLVVIEADVSKTVWMDKLSDSISYTFSSKLAREVSERDVKVLTVYGIRTFGKWQLRLHQLFTNKFDGIGCSSYQYGYFTFVAFLIPALRDREVKRLTEHLRQMFSNSGNKQFVIFAHSFGTYLVANAIKVLVSEGRSIPVQSIVLCGSVLDEYFDWGFFLRSTDGNVINDCADRDYILWLSKAFSIGTGMAGKSGFYGIQGGRIINRYFKGGHSSYFSGDSFMEKYWVPILLQGKNVCCMDQREPNTLLHGIFEKIVVLCSKLKRVIYYSLFMFFLYIIGKWAFT